VFGWTEKVTKETSATVRVFDEEGETEDDEKSQVDDQDVPDDLLLFLSKDLEAKYKNERPIGQWINRIISCSSFYTDYEAENMIGPSTVYPKYGDMSGVSLCF
jgi:hypothetical protein